MNQQKHQYRQYHWCPYLGSCLAFEIRATFWNYISRCKNNHKQLAAGLAALECSSVYMGPLYKGGRQYLHYLHHSLASGQMTWTQTRLSTENWIKDLLSTAPPIRTRPSFPLSQSLPSGSSHKPLILLHQRADRMKTTITENEPIWSHGPQLCLTQWNYEPCHVGPPKTDGSWWRVLTKCGPLEKRLANHFRILALRTPWTVWKGKKIGHWKMNSQVGRCLICYWRSVEN